MSDFSNELTNRLQGNYANYAQFNQDYAQYAQQVNYIAQGCLPPLSLGQVGTTSSPVPAIETEEAWLRRRVDEICWKVAA